MQVRSLEADLYDPEVVTTSGRERRFPDRVIREAPSQTADRTDHPQDHMYRIPGMQIRSLLVRRPGARALRWPTGATAAR